jgi:hypothetical protein
MGETELKVPCAGCWALGFGCLVKRKNKNKPPKYDILYY